MHDMLPESRQERLLMQKVGDELVIYDERTHEAHRLNASAAEVWRLADGTRDLPALATALRSSLARPDVLEQLDDAASLELVRIALVELDRTGLLARRLPELAALGEPISRRKMIGVAAALLPAIASIVAPTPAMAISCFASALANPSTVVPAGGTVTLTVTTTCQWATLSSANFITPVGSASGMGSGTATFIVGSNPGTTPRSGTITVSFPGNTGIQPTVTITQAGQISGGLIAIIQSPSSATVNSSVTFNGSSSVGSISSYFWDFGDGTTATGPIVNHTYPLTFISPFSSTAVNVTLTVTGAGGQHTATKSITVTRTY